MEVEDKSALSMPDLESIYKLCGIETHSQDAQKIEELVTAFCKEELPPKYDSTGQMPPSLCFDFVQNIPQKNFLKDSECSGKLIESLMPYLDHPIAFDHSPFEVYCNLVQNINNRSLGDRRYANGRSFTPNTSQMEQKANATIPDKQENQEKPQQSTVTPITLSFRPKIPVTIEDIQADDLRGNVRSRFAWKDVAFIIDVTECADCDGDQIRLLFSQAVDPQKPRPYSEEDFDVELLKEAILHDPDTRDLDLSDKHLWQENLLQSFRLVQSDMIVLLKAFHRNTILHTPQPWLNLKLRSKPNKKRCRASTPEIEPQTRRGRTLRAGGVRRSNYRAAHVISDDDNENEYNEDINPQRRSSRIRDKRARRY